MSNKVNREKNKIWLISTIIILTISLVLVISICSYLQETAWIFLGFAGTATSLVLSILAIVITLVDLSNQRHQLSEITVSSKKLKKLIKELKQENKDMKDELLNNLSNDYTNEMHKINELLKTIRKDIDKNENKKAIKEIDNYSENNKKHNLRNTWLRDLGGNQMLKRDYRVRKNIKESEIENFKDSLKNTDYNIQDIKIIKQENEDYDIMRIEANTTPLRINDLIVLVNAEFYPKD